MYINNKPFKSNMNKLLLILVLALFIMPMLQADLGTFKAGDCVQIRVLANCSSINLTEVTNQNITYSINDVMTSLGGQTFNYTFCNTTNSGTYSYSWNNPCVDCSNGDCGNSFKINPSGQDVTSEQMTLIVIGFIVLIILATFFFILSIMFKHPGTKIFLMALSSITLIFLIGMVVSNASVYLSEFTGLVSSYNAYYYFLIALAGAAMMGIIAWLIYYSTKQFHALRGIIPEE